MEVKEVLGSPRTGVMDGEPPCGCWGLNLQELGVLLVSESSLQTLEGLSLEDSPQNLCLTLQPAVEADCGHESSNRHAFRVTRCSSS